MCKMLQWEGGVKYLSQCQLLKELKLEKCPMRKNKHITLLAHIKNPQ